MVEDYLSGKEFSNCVRLRLGKKEKEIPDRIELICDIVRGKKVIDLGFADHIELIEKKLDKDMWLHKHLVTCTKRCLGIDINKKAVEFCQNNMPLKDIVYAPLRLMVADTSGKAIKEIMEDEWDYLVMGELIEHQNFPAGFLMNLQKYKTIKKILITTPNAFRIENFVWAKKYRELINSDHKFWFTPYTLSKAAYEAGYKVNWFGYCQSYPVSFYMIRKRILLKKYPAFRDTIIMEIQ